MCGVSHKSHKNCIDGGRVYNHSERDTTEPRQHATPFQYFFGVEGEKFSVAAVATSCVTGFADLYLNELGQCRL